MKYWFKYIRKGSAVLLLAIFILAITPRQYLHYFFASHHDSTIQIDQNQGDKISKGGYNCQCQDVVSESAFVSISTSLVNAIHTNTEYSAVNNISFVSIVIRNNNERGPPIMV